METKNNLDSNQSNLFLVNYPPIPKKTWPFDLSPPNRHLEPNANSSTLHFTKSKEHHSKYEVCTYDSVVWNEPSSDSRCCCWCWDCDTLPLPPPRYLWSSLSADFCTTFSLYYTSHALVHTHCLNKGRQFWAMLKATEMNWAASSFAMQLKWTQLHWHIQLCWFIHTFRQNSVAAIAQW